MQLDSATFPTLTTVTAVFDDPPTPSTVNTAAAWSVVLDGTGATVVVLSVDGEDTDWTLTVHPGVTPGATYRVTALTAEDGGGPADPAFVDADVPTALAPSDTDEWPRARYLEWFTEVVGAELATVRGAPTTRLVQPLAPTDTLAVVESTLGFAGAAVWIGGNRFTFTSKTDGAFLGLGREDMQLLTVHTGTEVVLDVATVEPGWLE